MSTRVLAIDLGAKRVGLAVSDPMGIIAQPLGFIEFISGRRLIADLKKIIEEKSIKTVLVGFPKNMDNTIGPQARECMEWSEKIQKECGVEVKLIDERLTTKQAENMLVDEFDLSRKKRKKVRDGIAACIILESYLNSTASKNF